MPVGAVEHDEVVGVDADLRGGGLRAGEQW